MKIIYAKKTRAVKILLNDKEYEIINQITVYFINRYQGPHFNHHFLLPIFYYE